MPCPHVRCVVLADIITDAPVVLCVGPKQTSGFDYVSGSLYARVLCVHRALAGTGRDA